MLCAFVGAFHGDDAVDLAIAEFRRIRSEPVFSAGHGDRIVVPDHQAGIVFHADEVLPTVVETVHRPLVNAVGNRKLGDQVVVGVKNAETVVVAGNEHIAMQVAGNVDIGITQ